MSSFFWPAPSASYDRLRNCFDQELSIDHPTKNLKPTDNQLEKGLGRKRYSGLKTTLLVWLNLSLFLFSAFLFFETYLITSQAKGSSRNASLREVSYNSPLLEALDIDLADKQMNASLLPSDPLSIFRMDPSPEVDEAWARIGDIRPIPITQDDIVKIGKDPTTAVKFPESFGLGPDAYVGRLDVLHQIHCLDALRREANFDHYYLSAYPDGLASTTQLHKLHLSHCTYLLLENIMCNANLEVYTHFWYRDTTGPFADFNVNKKCRNFDAILDWQESNAVNLDLFRTLTNPGEGKWMPKDLRAVFDENWEKHHMGHEGHSLHADE